MNSNWTINFSSHHWSFMIHVAKSTPRTWIIESTMQEMYMMCPCCTTLVLRLLPIPSHIVIVRKLTIHWNILCYECRRMFWYKQELVSKNQKEWRYVICFLFDLDAFQRFELPRVGRCFLVFEEWCCCCVCWGSTRSGYERSWFQNIERHVPDRQSTIFRLTCRQSSLCCI